MPFQETGTSIRYGAVPIVPLRTLGWEGPPLDPGTHAVARRTIGRRREQLLTRSSYARILPADSLSVPRHHTQVTPVEMTRTPRLLGLRLSALQWLANFAQIVLQGLIASSIPPVPYQSNAKPPPWSCPVTLRCAPTR